MAAPASRTRQLDAEVVAAMCRVPSELWAEPREVSLPAELRRELDAMGPERLRGLLVEVIHRLESQRR